MSKSFNQRLALVFFAFITCVHSYSQSFVNPISDLADPFITYESGYYYYTGTTGGNICLRKSATLEGIKAAPLQVVFSPGSGQPTHHYWAPELFRINSKWYIYFSASLTTSTNDMRTWVLENSAADPTTGSWVLKGRLYDAWNDYWAIDGTVLNLNGTNYFVWSGVDQYANVDKPQRIYIASMSNPWTLNAGRTLLSSPTLSWENNGSVNEGPEVIRKNGKVFLVYSANGCWTADYRLGMLSMNDWDNPMNAGAWYKHPNPVFTSNAATNSFGPGHHCFFKSPDGTQDWIAFHATTNAYGACDNSRTTRAQKISWNADGTPNFGIPGLTGAKNQAPAGESGLPGGSTVASGIYKIVAQSSNKPLDVAGCSIEMGANIQQWQDGNVNCQKWHIQATADGYYTITSLQGGLAMEVVGCSSANGANVQMWSPNGANCQKWSIVSVGGGYYKIVSRQSGKVLDIQFGGSNNGANCQQYDYLGASNQHFRLDWLGTESPMVAGTYRIISKKSDLALDLNNCDPNNGTNVGQWTWLNNNCQRWSVESTGDGYFMIRSMLSSKVLDIPYCSNQPGANVQVWQSYSNDCQKFSIQPAGNGYYSVINKSSGLALDVSDCSTQPGANVHQWGYWGGDCQLWKFDLVTNSARFTAESEVELEIAELNIYPNPACDFINVSKSFESEQVQIHLFDLMSREAASWTLGTENGNVQLDIRNLKSGIYLMMITDGVSITHRKIIIQ